MSICREAFCHGQQRIGGSARHICYSDRKLAGEEQAGQQTEDVGSILHSRASRSSRDDVWLDTDHYFEQDLPSDSFKDGEWKERYKDMDEIQVNGAIRRQWKKGKLEIEEIVNRCSVVLGKDELFREDFVECFHGPNSRLF